MSELDRRAPHVLPSTYMTLSEIEAETEGTTPASVRETLLPRFAWSNRLTYLRVVMQAKQCLDQQERTFFF
ncbi:MAG: hypothetical protein AAGF01_00645 [Cyanobacteria bacterium P01_G01_bin.38]